MRLCKDCKHARPWRWFQWRFIPRVNFRQGQCLRGFVQKIDPISGGPHQTDFPPSLFEARYMGKNGCGPEGKLWEAR